MYGDATPNIVRTEPNEERMLIAVSEGAGITMLLAARTATLRLPGVVYRRFVDPEPTGILALAFHQPPPPAAQRLIDRAREIARQARSGRQGHEGKGDLQQ